MAARWLISVLASLSVHAGVGAVLVAWGGDTRGTSSDGELFVRGNEGLTLVLEPEAAAVEAQSGERMDAAAGIARDDERAAESAMLPEAEPATPSPPESATEPMSVERAPDTPAEPAPAPAFRELPPAPAAPLATVDTEQFEVEQAARALSALRSARQNIADLWTELARMNASFQQAQASRGARSARTASGPPQTTGAPSATHHTSPAGPSAPSAPVAITRGPSPLRWNAAPKYPDECRRRKQQGTVLVHVVIESDGAVAYAAVSRSSGVPLLDAAALDAVRTWRFTPASAGSTSVRSEADLPVVFVLRD